MIQGTNPTTIFALPFDTTFVKTALVVYSQDNVTVLRKETADCTMEGRYLGVPLTQEETLSFDHKRNVEVQLRVLTTENDAYVSPVYIVDVKRCLTNEVII